MQINFQSWRDYVARARGRRRCQDAAARRARHDLDNPRISWRTPSRLFEPWGATRRPSSQSASWDTRAHTRGGNASQVTSSPLRPPAPAPRETESDRLRAADVDGASRSMSPKSFEKSSHGKIVGKGTNDADDLDLDFDFCRDRRSCKRRHHNSWNFARADFRTEGATTGAVSV